ncbi:MAG TPA: mechanosensitive ion channel domain-containing protein [Ktedonobacteraceae bacterium]
MTNMGWQIVLLIGIVLVDLAIGYFVRRWAVRRMKTTVLDDWAIHTIGIAILVPFLLVAIIALLFFFSPDFNFLSSFWTNLASELKNATITNSLLGILGNIVLTLLIVGLGVGIGRTVMRLVTGGRLAENRLDINIRTLLGRIIYGITLVVVVFWILSLWQVSIAVPVAVISGLTVAVTFAIQDILKDLVAGMYILVEHPFHIGDQITTASYTGQVENVQLRATRLRLVSGEEVSIPNALVFGGIVVNNTEYEQRRATISLIMLQDAFHEDETPAQILKVVKEMEYVLVKPEPNVAVSRFTGMTGGFTEASTGYTGPGKAVFLTLRFWMPEGRYQTVTEVMCALHKALPDADLVVQSSGGDI